MMKLTEEDVQAYGEGLMRWIESDEISLDDLFEGKVYRFTRLPSERSTQRSYQFQWDVFRGTMSVSKCCKS